MSPLPNKQIILTAYMSLVTVLMSIPLFNNQFIFFIQLFSIGVCIGFSGSIEVTLLQKKVPKRFFGRVMTLFSSARFRAVPVGDICFGWMLETDLAKWTLTFMAGVVFTSILIYWYLNYNNTKNTCNHPKS